jgi:DNA-directed RNA polymerase subunit RPC12/RpoP
VSLKKKLAPAAKERGIGKRVKCDRCGSPDAEHYSANYVQCPRCDSPKAEADEPIEVRWRSLDWGGPAADDSEDTSPGWSPFASWKTSSKWYRCGSCKIQTLIDPDSVAAGARCMCGGMLVVLP